MEIRRMRIDDYDAVYSLWMSCVGMGLNNLDDSRDGIGKFLTRNPDTCFVAVQEEAVVGVILAGHDGRRGYIYHTAVHPQHRHRGIGSNLVVRALDGLKDNGITKVALLVFERNQTANAFWERIGFTAREDVIYRNKAIADLIRIDT